MFAIRHRPDGMWWIDTREYGSAFYASGWSTDPDRARSFETKEDAEMAAFLECSCPFDDIEAVDLSVVFA